MKTTIEWKERSTITDFAKKHNLTMEVIERDLPSLPRFFCHFKNTEVKEGSFLSGISGNGDTINDAIANYANNISGKLIVVGSYTKSRTEIRVPLII